MPSDQGTCPACWSTEELPGAVCPQSAVAWGSSVSTLRVGVLRFTGSCRQLCTRSCRIADLPSGLSCIFLCTTECLQEHVNHRTHSLRVVIEDHKAPED